MPSFYHVMIIPRSGVDQAAVDKKFDLALDWFRFNRTNWIIFTNKDADIWFSRLREFVEPGGKLFICKLDVSDRQGWVSKKLWEWLGKDRSRTAQRLGSDAREL